MCPLCSDYSAVSLLLTTFLYTILNQASVLYSKYSITLDSAFEPFHGDEFEKASILYFINQIITALLRCCIWAAKLWLYGK